MLYSSPSYELQWNIFFVRIKKTKLKCQKALWIQNIWWEYPWRFIWLLLIRVTSSVLRQYVPVCRYVKLWLILFNIQDYFCTLCLLSQNCFYWIVMLGQWQPSIIIWIIKETQQTKTSSWSMRKLSRLVTSCDTANNILIVMPTHYIIRNAYPRPLWEN